MAEITLQFIAEQLKLVLEQLASLRDQQFILSSILQRFEYLDRTNDNSTILALQQQIERLRRRVEALEEKSR